MRSSVSGTAREMMMREEGGMIKRNHVWKLCMYVASWEGGGGGGGRVSARR